MACSLFCKTSGSFNVAIGYQALHSNTLNGKNIAIGCKAGYNSTCAVNILIGSIAGCLLNGSNNTFIGSYSGSKSTEATGNTFFGHNSVVRGRTIISFCIFSRPVIRIYIILF